MYFWRFLALSRCMTHNFNVFEFHDHRTCNAECHLFYLTRQNSPWIQKGAQSWVKREKCRRCSFLTARKSFWLHARHIISTRIIIFMASNEFAIITVMGQRMRARGNHRRKWTPTVAVAVALAASAARKMYKYISSSRSATYSIYQLSS